MDCPLLAAVLALFKHHHGVPALASPVLITVAQAAQRLGVARQWIYAHQKTLPWVVRISPRKIRVDEAGLVKWLAEGGYASTRPRGRDVVPTCVQKPRR